MLPPRKRYGAATNLRAGYARPHTNLAVRALYGILRSMRWLVLVLLVACEKTATPNAAPVSKDAAPKQLDGPVACGEKTCTSGQVCITVSAGSQCMVSEKIGPYQTYEWLCVDLPAACHGVASCACVEGPGMCLGVSPDGRTVGRGCI
jgi:hypothetical protein